MSKKCLDVLIAGGGVMGCSAAYHLKKADPRLRVAVVEKDPSYQFASTPLSWGGVRVQFSLKENILISLHTLEVLKDFAGEMEADGSRPDVSFRQDGYLFLIDAAGETEARASLGLQKSIGCEVEWWPPGEIKERYPLLDVSGFAGGTFGPKDGYVDPYALLMGYKAKARSLGTEFVTDTVVSFDRGKNHVQGARLASGAVLKSAAVINAAGVWSADLARTAGVVLPVEPVKRQCFAVKPEAAVGRPLPLIVAPGGLFFRSETGGLVLVGHSFDEDPVGFDFSFDRGRFEEILWPELAELVPVLDSLKFVRGWAGLYDVNRLDSNAIIGEWPELPGFYVCCGFSGHGLMQSPAVGRWLSELILGKKPALDLAVLGPRRVLENKPIKEKGLV